jgi:hypothetical protein
MSVPYVSTACLSRAGFWSSNDPPATVGGTDMNAIFSPTAFCGEPVKVSGIITFNYVAQR